MEGKFTFPDPHWTNITPEGKSYSSEIYFVCLRNSHKIIGKDIISKFLTVDPAERITAELALNHPWFKVFKNNK